MKNNHPLVFKFLCKEVFEDIYIDDIAFSRNFIEKELIITDNDGNRTYAYIDEINGLILGYELCHDGKTKISHQLDLDNIERSETFLRNNKD